MSFVDGNEAKNIVRLQMIRVDVIENRDCLVDFERGEV